MNALDDYKRRSGRMFPTCSEILEVIRDLGYRRVSGEEVAASDVVQATVSAAPMTISNPEPISSPQPASPLHD